jgi:hypothetical protein
MTSLFASSRFGDRKATVFQRGFENILVSDFVFYDKDAGRIFHVVSSLAKRRELGGNGPTLSGTGCRI